MLVNQTRAGKMLYMMNMNGNRKKLYHKCSLKGFKAKVCRIKMSLKNLIEEQPMSCLKRKMLLLFLTFSFWSACLSFSPEISSNVYFIVRFFSQNLRECGDCHWHHRRLSSLTEPTTSSSWFQKQPLRQNPKFLSPLQTHHFSSWRIFSKIHHISSKAWTRAPPDLHLSSSII